MTWLTSVVIVSIVSATTSTAKVLVSGSPDVGAPASCSVTVQSTPAFFAPPPYPQHAPGGRSFWHGTRTLWTMLEADGTWPGLPRNPNGFRQKVFWWSPGFDGRVEGRRSSVSSAVDSMVPNRSSLGPATNAHHADFGGWTILTGIDVPTAGCWELTGTYRENSLTFVVWIP